MQTAQSKILWRISKLKISKKRKEEILSIFDEITKDLKTDYSISRNKIVKGDTK